MKGVVSFFIIVATIFIFAATGYSQEKVVNFKTLQTFLPKIDLAGFTRQKPGGETSSAFGMSSSSAHVLYTKRSGDNQITIEVKISDLAGIPFGDIAGAMAGMIEFNNETETGYEKSIIIQGFKGTELVDRSEDNQSAEIKLFVTKRFLVELNSQGTSDVALLHKLCNDMNLNGLANLSK